MLKIQNNIATREPIPSFLIGLAPESLADLSWTDPALGVSDAAWWPEEDQSPALGQYERYGDETLTIDADNQRVIVVRAVVPWGAEEIEADIAEKRARKWEAIKAERDRRTHTGGYPAAGKWFHSDTFSRSQQLGLVMMGANIPAGLMWKTMDGSFIEMTQVVANDIFIAAGVQDAATFAHAESLKAQVEASDDPASIDIKSGWPICFLDIE